MQESVCLRVSYRSNDVFRFEIKSKLHRTINLFFVTQIIFGRIVSKEVNLQHHFIHVPLLYL